MLDVVVPYVHKHWPDDIHGFGIKHDIKGILDQIEHKKIVQEEAVQENTAEEEIVQEEAVQGYTVQDSEEPVQGYTVQEEPVQGYTDYTVQEEIVQKQSFKTLLRMKNSSKKGRSTRSRQQKNRGYDVGEEDNRYMAPFKSCFAQFFNSWRK